MLRKDIRVGWRVRKCQFFLTLYTENVLRDHPLKTLAVFTGRGKKLAKFVDG